MEVKLLGEFRQRLELVRDTVLYGYGSGFPGSAWLKSALLAIFAAKVWKSRRASIAAAAWLPMAPSAAVKSNIGLRLSCPIGTKLR